MALFCCCKSIAWGSSHNAYIPAQWGLSVDSRDEKSGKDFVQ